MDSGPAASPPPPALAVIGALAAVKLLVHLALSGRYGYFRDELYFLDCGRHLDWGYVDHAPLIGLVARLALLLGGSLHALRAIPAVAGAGLVVLTGLITWRLGGGRFAQGLAGLAVLLAPIILGVDSLMTMNALEPLFWMGAAYVVIRIVQTGDSRRWLWFGALVGLGLENKHSTAFFGLAVLCGILLTPLRGELRRPWIWLGGLVAFLVFAPNLAWQAAHGFPTLEDLRNVARSGKNVALPPLAFIRQQVMMLNPFLAPLWLAGLGWLLAGRRYRALGVTFLAVFACMMALHGKDYYLAPIYPLLFAAGAVALEQGLARWPPTAGRLAPRAALLGAVTLLGLPPVPLVLPLLSPEGYLAYERSLGVERGRTEVHHAGPLPQMFGDQFGWPELVAEVARAYHALPPEERARTAIFAGNYGEAGAINHLGAPLGLPRAISGHQTYFFWGPQGYTGESVLVLQSDRAELEGLCASVTQVGEHFHPWGMEEENGPIFHCRGLKTPLASLWPRVKHWN